MTPQRSPDNSGKKCFLTIFNFSGDHFLSSSCARRRSSCARRGSCTRRRSSSCARRRPYMSLLVLISAYWGLLLLIGAYYCLLKLIWPAYWCLLVLIWSAYGCLLLLISYEKTFAMRKELPIIGNITMGKQEPGDAPNPYCTISHPGIRGS